MVRQGTPYLAQIELDNNLSDIDLYKEARIEENYKVILQPKQANDILTIERAPKKTN